MFLFGGPGISFVNGIRNDLLEDVAPDIHAISVKTLKYRFSKYFSASNISVHDEEVRGLRELIRCIFKVTTFFYGQPGIRDICMTGVLLRE